MGQVDSSTRRGPSRAGSGNRSLNQLLISGMGRRRRLLEARSIPICGPERPGTSQGIACGCGNRGPSGRNVRPRNAASRCVGGNALSDDYRSINPLSSQR